jgi:hypothetical protein
VLIEEDENFLMRKQLAPNQNFLYREGVGINCIVGPIRSFLEVMKELASIQ